jgi:hypothetical protein
LKNLNKKFEKPTTKDLQELAEWKLSDEEAQDLLNQLEEFCLIIIEHYNENGQQI